MTMTIKEKPTLKGSYINFIDEQIKGIQKIIDIAKKKEFSDPVKREDNVRKLKLLNEKVKHPWEEAKKDLAKARNNFRQIRSEIENIL